MTFKDKVRHGRGFWSDGNSDKINDEESQLKNAAEAPTKLKSHLYTTHSHLTVKTTGYFT